MDAAELLLAIGQTSLTLFVIIDAVGNLPIVATLLGGFSPEERRNAVDTSVLVSLGILVASALVGTQLLGLFGIGTGEMLIAGGLLLTVLAMDMMFSFLPAGTCDPRTVCVVPVATPLLAGPGAITTVLLTVQRYPSPGGYVIAGVAMIVALALSWVVLRRTDDLMRLLGERGSLIVGKLVGILVMAIAVSFVVRGVTTVVEQLGAR